MNGFYRTAQLLAIVLACTHQLSWGLSGTSELTLVENVEFLEEGVNGVIVSVTLSDAAAIASDCNGHHVVNFAYSENTASELFYSLVLAAYSASLPVQVDFNSNSVSCVLTGVILTPAVN